jgi:valyl-tRNA synthetase
MISVRAPGALFSTASRGVRTALVELAKTYDPKAAEERWFQLWIDRGYFTADPERPGKVFSIVIPPPNVTGQLHLGHALNTTLHDIIVRMRRMQGYNTLWLPGTDHAGIATQNAVERALAQEGKNRHQLGREAFVDRVWKWREEYGGRILTQLRRLGASCDWTRERFTLDEGLSRAVTRVFVTLYEKGLIYRAPRMINWCPRCETALSDLEVDHKDQKSSLWYIRYPLTDGSGSITVATTRPETMLGDTAVAVNPDDARFAGMVGRTARLPLVGRDIPIIADAAVEQAFGAGAVKITPGHDFNDFEIGRRHNLDQISVIDTRARMNENAGPYRGLDRDAARKRVVADLETAGLLEKIEPHAHKVGVCSRCSTVVEPLISEQWFVRVKEMANRAIEAVKRGDTTFFPHRWEKTFFEWMENIHDWTISRQLWWGHRIPAYRCLRCNETIIAAERPHACGKCGGNDIAQDEDVLDTWFSSGLWPFSTLGWPEDTADLRKYYPTSLLITGFDIIFFWVARMMMLGLEFTGQVPFRHVYITTLVRDQYGQKMTKSKGNVVDPLDLMNQYGTDAVRLTLAQQAIQGGDIILSHDRFAASRAFANKIWNAARFVMMNLDGAPQPIPAPDRAKLGLAERWILSRLDAAVCEITRSIDAYEFNVAAMAIYRFIWHEFCDWYIELAKEPLRAGGERQAVARWVLVTCFDTMLRLLHPFMPFISEDLWQVMRPYLPQESLSEHLAVAKFPEPAAHSWMSEEESWWMEHALDATRAVNSLRSFAGIHPGEKIHVFLQADVPLEGSINVSHEKLVREVKYWGSYVQILGRASGVEVVNWIVPPDGSRFLTQKLAWATVFILAPDGFDFEKKRRHVEKELAEVRVHRVRHQERLENPQFVAKASKESQEETRQKWEELSDTEVHLQAQLEMLGAQTDSNS